VHSSFILSDIVYFAKNFKTVLLFSTGKVNVALPENVVIYQEYLDWKKFRAPLLLLSGFFSILSIYMRESLSAKRLLPLRQSVSLLASNFFKAKEIERLLKEDKRFSTTHIGYSFWFYDCIFLAWL